MTFEIWLGYVVACAIVVLIPGPNVIFTVTYALQDGARSGWATIPGVLLGAFGAMTLSLAGAGALLNASVFWFNVLKITGALYLFWLAYSLWTSPIGAFDVDAARSRKSMTALFWQGVLISLLNPKGPPFYVAFVPQFVSSSSPVLPQFGTLIGTFLIVALVNCVLWVWAARTIRGHAKSPRVLRLISRTGAACLFGASAMTLRTTRLG